MPKAFNDSHTFSLPSLGIQYNPNGFTFSVMPAFVCIGKKLIPFRACQKLPEIGK